MTLEKLAVRMESLRLTQTAAVLGELAQASAVDKETPLEFLERVLEAEYSGREERRIATSLKLSGLPRGMRLEDFDYLFQPAVERDRIEYLGTGDFLAKTENVLFFGPPGVGKTHLSVGLGVRAVELGYSVSYYTAEELLAHLKRRAEVPVSKQRRQNYVKNALVIVDELGYQQLDRQETHLFFQFVAARYLRGSTIITSNRSVKDWVAVFAGDHAATTAILDRLLHKAQIFQIDGRSYRLRHYETLLNKGAPND